MCLGYKDSKSNTINVSLAQLLSENKYNIFLFDFSNEIKEEDVIKKVEELRSVVEYFSKDNKVILIGFSMGALVSAILSKNTTKVAKLITVNGFFGFPLLKWSVFKIYLGLVLSSIYDLSDRNIFKYILKNLDFKDINIPVVCISSKEDKIVSSKQSELFFKSVGTRDKKIVSLNNITHNCIKEGEVKILASVLVDTLSN